MVSPGWMWVVRVLEVGVLADVRRRAELSDALLRRREDEREHAADRMVGAE